MTFNAMAQFILSSLLAGWLVCVVLSMWRIWLACIILIGLLWFASSALAPATPQQTYRQQQPIMPFSQRWAFTEPHQ